jgi:hypothetical protein
MNSTYGLLQSTVNLAERQITGWAGVIGDR